MVLGEAMFQRCGGWRRFVFAYRVGRDLALKITSEKHRGFEPGFLPSANPAVRVILCSMVGAA